jgi:hypothetical protein
LQWDRYLPVSSGCALLYAEEISSFFFLMHEVTPIARCINAKPSAAEQYFYLKKKEATF